MPAHYQRFRLFTGSEYSHSCPNHSNYIIKGIHNSESLILFIRVCSEDNMLQGANNLWSNPFPWETNSISYA